MASSIVTSVARPDSALSIKLSTFTQLSSEDRKALARSIVNVRVVDARHDVTTEGNNPKFVHVVIEGWACTYKSLADGKRQILGLFLPGDFCDVNVYVLRRMDHSIGAITRLKVAMISAEEMAALTAERPKLTQALWWEALVTAAIQREWTLSMGQRSARARIAHLLLELYVRLTTVRRTANGRFDFPLTQNDIADATGLTPVHVNRMLQELRGDGLIDLGNKQLQLIDLPRLTEVAMFNAEYLHLDHEGRHLDGHG